MLKTEQQNSKEHPFFKTTADAPPPAGRYTPTCSLCGKQHWPLDPSCLGKKGAKARLKAQAKAEAEAKAQAKRQAKLEAKAHRKNKGAPPKTIQHVSSNNEDAGAFAQKISRIQHQAEKAIATAESKAEDALQAERKKCSKIQAQSEQRIQSYVEEIAKTKSEMAEAVSKEQAELKKQAEEKLEIRAEADAEIKKITSMLISSKEILRIEIDAKRAVEKKLAEEISKRRQLEVDAIEKNKCYNEELAKLRTQTSELKSITETRLKKKLQEELKLRSMLQTDVSAKTKSFVRQIDTLKANSARSLQENEAKAADARIDNVTFEETDVSRTLNADIPGSMTSRLLAIKAEDIMLNNIVWASPDDSVRDVFEKIQPGNEYVIIGDDGIAEGIVSKAYLKGIASPYLRSLMEKWKQGQNDDTLDIEIKWLMNRKMQTISRDTSCTAIMKKMHQYSTALPVVDENNKVLGLVTPFNILKIRALLKLESSPIPQK